MSYKFKPFNFYNSKSEQVFSMDQNSGYDFKKYFHLKHREKLTFNKRKAEFEAWSIAHNITDSRRRLRGMSIN